MLTNNQTLSLSSKDFYILSIASLSDFVFYLFHDVCMHTHAHTHPHVCVHTHLAYLFTISLIFLLFLQNTKCISTLGPLYLLLPVTVKLFPSAIQETCFHTLLKDLFYSHLSKKSSLTALFNMNLVNLITIISIY